MRSIKLLNYDYWINYCQAIFGVDLLIDRTIAEFSFDHIAATNTVFTNGIDDPWQWATELEPNAAMG